MPDTRAPRLGLPSPEEPAAAAQERSSSDATTFVVRGRRPSPPRSKDPENPCLVTIHGPGLGRRVEIDRDEFSIGRGPRNDLIVLLGDISRCHCRILRKERGLWVRDLESTNGTHVNDEVVVPGVDVPLRSGDHLNLGGVIFKLLDGGNLESAYHEELYRTAIIDGLTQIHNRRYLGDFFEREMARSLRHDRPLALLLMDVDEFKRINDEFGHLGGDQVLRELAATLSRQIRREGCFARYGGEEFAVVLPET